MESAKTVFIVDDEPSISKLLTYWVRDKWGYKVQVFERSEPMLERLHENPSLILLDIMLPGMNGIEALQRIKAQNEHLPIIILSAQGRIDVALEAIRFGAFDYFPKPIDAQRLEGTIKNAIKNYELSRELESLRENVKREYRFENIVSVDGTMQEIFKLMTKVMNTDITVLIHGESGTGKELIAKAIHFNGSRKDKPFVVINCASIPRELLESELFGHEKGAFTGAYQRKAGKFEIANGGTLFLDEIGEFEMSLQAKLLRAIQERSFERIGGNETIKTDVRIISATNRDLKTAVEKKEFREDLFYRLNSFPVNLPPLRQRRSDILLLASHFLQSFNAKLGKNIKGFSRRANKLMYEYVWPGNIREMENAIERSVIITENDIIDIDDLPHHIRSAEESRSFDTATPFFSDDVILPFEKIKEESIRHALRVTEGNILLAAKKLQLGRATIYRLIERYSINLSEYETKSKEGQ